MVETPHLFALTKLLGKLCCFVDYLGPIVHYGCISTTNKVPQSDTWSLCFDPSYFSGGKTATATAVYIIPCQTNVLSVETVKELAVSLRSRLAVHVMAVIMDPRLLHHLHHLHHLLRLRPQLRPQLRRLLLLMANVLIMTGGRTLLETIVLGTRPSMVKTVPTMVTSGQTLIPVSLRVRLAATAAVAIMLTQTQILQVQPQPHLRPKLRLPEASAVVLMARGGVTGQKDVDSTSSREHVLMLCQPQGARGGIRKDRSAGRTGASGITPQSFVPEDGIKAASI